ncbi:MAG: hypothetical protein HYY96_05160 [Candidatus Tectomicrobia bacterium]|nr:hypothetical protein [Candidatus Tectomicrobia bacterium]
MITFRTLPIELLEAEAELLVCAYFADLIPLRGDASWVDWRLNGQVSQLLLANRAQGEYGEALLLPSRGKLPCPKVLLLGMGESRELTSERLVEGCARLIERAAKMQVRGLAISVIGREQLAVEYEQNVTDMIDGLLAGCNRLFSSEEEFTVIFVEDEKRRFDVLLKTVRFAIESFTYRFLADRDPSCIGGNPQES